MYFNFFLQENYNKKYNNTVNKHNKTEEETRKEIFKKNYQMIKEHNNSNKSKVTFSMGMNKFGDLVR